MEASSPLAAMHRPMPAPAWGNRDLFRPRPHSHYSSSSSGMGSVSLREQLHKSTADYFSVKEVCGSSPAASLAADLSQNFRLDNEASPHFPTPRRALFTANMMGGMDGRHFVTTPPLPSSSPAPVVEHMELSPLPHKNPFFAQVEMESPTPGSTPSDDHDMVLDSPAPIARQAPCEPTKSFLADRRIAAPRRPSLSRMKVLSSSSLPPRVQSETHNPLPPFRFGADFGVGRTSSNLSLGECFESASPPMERRPLSSNSPCAPVALPPPRRPLFTSVGSTSGARLGSPVNCHARRQSNPFLRNRKQFRRSLSMFEHPADIMKPKTGTDDAPSSALKAVMDIEEVHEPVLPHFLLDDPTDSIPRIARETFLDILDGKYAEHFDQKMVIDCRFEYEYDGGHIEGAVNHNDKELLGTQLFQTPIPGRTLLIFHCEYSAHRAPLMARHIRSHDRTINAEHYPALTYPEVYILDGGYSGFFAEHRGRCYPPQYVEMSDEKHQRTCEREMGRLKARKGLGRSQTFAFGQREPCVHDSPTAPSRPTSRNTTLSTLANSPIFGDRSQTRRMASY
ncbi:m-phase inducer phosphatase [Conoideocrella luteorostrata]|uniref:M-phase inducer phosphatase n=1 Tax=Conoideocrella luteorostrata TaxID=1105319 RepID=A0AAJ0CQF9_9HYPO|nr:m-phase inducer phosphatase [Conoideocrella luteorostrata]